MPTPIQPGTSTAADPLQLAAVAGGPTDTRSWGPLLDRVSREHEGDRVTIAPLDAPVNGPGGGPAGSGYGEAPQRLPFTYASYSPRDNVVVVAVGGTTPTLPVVLRHLIWKPAQLWVTTGALRVVDTDGVGTEVTFFPGSGYPQ